MQPIQPQDAKIGAEKGSTARRLGSASSLSWGCISDDEDE